MRQLDLFGSLVETPPAEEKQEEKKTVSEKAEEVSSVSGTDGIPYSLVQLAEEALGTGTSNGSDEIIITLELDKKPLEQSEKKSGISFLANDISKESFSAITTIKKSQIDPNSFASADICEDKKKNNDGQQNVVNIPEPQRNGTVIFDNGKITVKVKNKNIAANTGIEEKQEIEPQKIEQQKIEQQKEELQEIEPQKIEPQKVESQKIEQQKKEPQKRGRKSLQEIEAEVDLIEVPDDEELFQKQYYPISQVAKWFRVNTSLLRFWENEFEILKPKKNRKGDRLFRPEDVKNLQLIYQLLRQRKYTIEGAKEYIKTNRKKADTELQLTNTLQKFKSFLLDLKANLQS